MDNIKIIDGNLLDFPNDIGFIAHSCNTSNLMGANCSTNKRSLPFGL